MMIYPIPIVLVLLIAASSGCKKSSESNSPGQVPPTAEVPCVTLAEQPLSSGQSLSPQKGLEVLSSHSNAYIRNNAVEAITQWKSKNYLPAAVAFQAILGLIRTPDEQTIFYSSFEPFRREVRDAAQRNNAAAKEASKFLDQAFDSH
ncbi:MAG: hypothetical protein JWM99_2583 [Verrucomicrobiales bacterium]|nr:hypothetical protein [Verrucomicrobiales bacterium]